MSKRLAVLMAVLILLTLAGAAGAQTDEELVGAAESLRGFGMMSVLADPPATAEAAGEAPATSALPTLPSCLGDLAAPGGCAEDCAPATALLEVVGCQGGAWSLRLDGGAHPLDAPGEIWVGELAVRLPACPSECPAAGVLDAVRAVEGVCP